MHGNIKAALNNRHLGWKLNKCGIAMSSTSFPRGVATTTHYEWNATTCSCEFTTMPSCQVGLLLIGQISAFTSELLDWPLARASHEVVDWAWLGSIEVTHCTEIHCCDSSSTTIQLVESSKKAWHERHMGDRFVFPKIDQNWRPPKSHHEIAQPKFEGLIGETTSFYFCMGIATRWTRFILDLPGAYGCDGGHA